MTLYALFLQIIIKNSISMICLTLIRDVHWMILKTLPVIALYLVLECFLGLPRSKIL